MAKENTWIDRMTKEQRAKYSPETLNKWRASAIDARKQMDALQKNPHRNLPSTAPARMAYDDSQREKQLKTKVAKKMK